MVPLEWHLIWFEAVPHLLECVSIVSQLSKCSFRLDSSKFSKFANSEFYASSVGGTPKKNRGTETCESFLNPSGSRGGLKTCHGLASQTRAHGIAAEEGERLVGMTCALPAYCLENFHPTGDLDNFLRLSRLAYQGP